MNRKKLTKESRDSTDIESDYFSERSSDDLIENWLKINSILNHKINFIYFKFYTLQRS